MYSILLWASRNAIRRGASTPLSRATNFLYGDYTKHAIWWEPLEMCRKLTLVGWVLLIGDEAELARILVALLVSTVFLALHLGVKPFRRAEDGAIMMVTEGALVLTNFCAVRFSSSLATSPQLCVPTMASEKLPPESTYSLLSSR